MELKKLTPEHVRKILARDGQRVYLIDYSEKYMEELLAQYDISGRLAGILSDVKDRMSGDIAKGSHEVTYQGLSLPVYPYSYVRELDEGAALIILNDYFKETFQKLIRHGDAEEDCSTQKRHCAFRDCYYFADRETEMDLSYRERYQDSPLEDIILFRSGPHASSYVKGMDYADNARALFEYMLEAGYNRKYELIWLVKEPLDFTYITEGYKNVRFLSFDWPLSDREEERDAYYRALCLAKYIFMTDAYGFCRNARHDQIRVQLWHGCGFKTRINFVRCEERYEYNTVISEKYKEIHEVIYGLRQDQVIVTGYPKNDWLFHPDMEWKDKLNIPESKYYIFWLPTFRKPVGQLAELKERAPEGQTGLPMIYRMEELEGLNRILVEKDIQLVIKLHPFQDPAGIHCGGLSNIVLLTNEMLAEKKLQINQILGHADGLISDYSSAAIDYLLLDRPVAFTLDDVEEYEKSRGFVFTPIRDWLPGDAIYCYEDFVKYVEDIACGNDRAIIKRRRLTKKLHGFFDDKSSRRVVEVLDI
ncbi:MAG: hypothetical protein HFH12_00795 [Dorea sp.]|nr:hypothetical protein [Dorea sp.]